jgi:glutaredoxin
MEVSTDTITVIGASWCGDCRRTKAFLTDRNIAFDWIDLEEHPEATDIVERVTNGDPKIPTVLFPDGSHLREPSNTELAEKLGLTDSK